MTKVRFLASWLMVFGAVCALAGGSFSKQEKKEMKKMLDGMLYARIDMPCATGRHAYGTYKRPLVEVSPSGVNTDGENQVNASWYHADSTYWGVRVNDAMELDELDIEDEGIEIELEGVGDSEDRDTTILFVNCNSMDDFKKCFKRAFSKVPLQDEHADWSAEVKSAIASRQLTSGMNKRQAYCVTGTPERFEKKQEAGKKVEVWYLRQNTGMKMGYFKSKSSSTGLPASVKFVNGKLVDLVKSGTGSDFSLDD